MPVPTARYLSRVQYDTAATAVIAEVPQDFANVGPAYLRSRAQYYRELAEHETDRRRARLFRERAAVFDTDAACREKRRD